MARGRRRLGARSRRRGRWYAGAAVLATAATVLITYAAWPPPGTAGTSAAHRRTAPVADPAAPPGGSLPHPPGTTASPSPSPSPHRSPSASPAAPARASARASGAAAGRPSAVPAGSRLITVVNRTADTVWAVVTDSPAYPRGRRLAPGRSTSLTVADNWGGRVWGRTGCVSTAAGPCASGDCTSVCTGPNPPTTLGEFSLGAYAGLDFYDVSMVDGSNLPMYINISHTTTADPVSAAGCYRGVCTTPVDCPAPMRALSGGRVVGCEPPCAAFGGDTYCCRGAWAGRENCLPSKWPVDYTRVFKKAEPYAYSYAFDDGATMSCKGACHYRVTFGTTG